MLPDQPCVFFGLDYLLLFPPGDVAVRAGFSELLHAHSGDLGAADEKLFELLHALKLIQCGVGDTWADLPA